MNSQTLQLSDLPKILLQKLSHHPTPQSLHNKHFLDELDVLFLTKKPITHTFICNQSTSVQIELKSQKSKPLEDYDLNSWNKVMTHYYQTCHDHDKYLYTLNCNDRTLAERYGIQNRDGHGQNGNGMFAEEEASCLDQIDKEYEPHAYQPLFYFPRNVFDFFVKNRQTLSLAQPLEKIRITDWVIKIVNISKSVWYSLVIQVYKFRFLNEKVWVDETQLDNSKKGNTLLLKNIGSIVYDKRFQPIFEKMRLDDIKRDFQKTTMEVEEEPVSMCYHLRNVQTSHKLPKLSQFVALDIKGEVIKFDPKRVANFIPIGELEGMCSFPQPVNLNEPQKKQQMREINAFSMKGLHEILNKQAAQIRKDKEIRQRIERYNVTGKEKPGSSDWNQMMKQRVQSSLYRANENIDYQNSQQESELWSDSGVRESMGNENQMEEENYVTRYSDLLNNAIEVSDSEDSSEQQENQYFRKYREEMKTLFEQR